MCSGNDFSALFLSLVATVFFRERRRASGGHDRFFQRREIRADKCTTWPRDKIKRRARYARINVQNSRPHNRVARRRTRTCHPTFTDNRIASARNTPWSKYTLSSNHVVTFYQRLIFNFSALNFWVHLIFNDEEKYWHRILL